MVRSNPERVAADPHTVVALGQCAMELPAPCAGDSLQIESISYEIPLGAREYLHLSSCQVPIEIGGGEVERILYIRLRDRVGDRPRAEFVASQSGREIGNGDVEQILLGLEENTDMPPPRHVAHDANTGSPQPRIGGALLRRSN